MSDETFQLKAPLVDEGENSTSNKTFVVGTDHNPPTPTWSVTTSDVGYGDTLAVTRLDKAHRISSAGPAT